MRFVFALAVLLSFFIGKVAAAVSDTRIGRPKDCCMLRDNCGRGLAETTLEFRLGFLKRWWPDVSYPSGKTAAIITTKEESQTLPWIEKKAEPSIESLATIKGRRVVRATYPKEEESHAAPLLVAMETAKGSGWFAPFFMARSNGFEYQPEFSSDVEDGCVLTFHNIADDSLSEHYVFALAGKQPVFVGGLPLRTKSLAGGDDTRHGDLKDCYFYERENEEGLARVSLEFRVAFLKRWQPEMDFQFALSPKPTSSDGVDREDARCLTWKKAVKEPEIQPLKGVNGRKVIHAIYHPSEDRFGDIRLSAMETAKGSGWFAPFFVATEGDYFEDTQVSTRDMEAGYIATISYSGTGKFRSHYAFELQGKQPVFLVAIDNGRCHRGDYSSDEAYAKAYAQWEQDCKEEEALCEGVLSRRLKARRK